MAKSPLQRKSCQKVRFNVTQMKKSSLTQLASITSRNWENGRKKAATVQGRATLCRSTWTAAFQLGRRGAICPPAFRLRVTPCRSSFIPPPLPTRPPGCFLTSGSGLPHADLPKLPPAGSATGTPSGPPAHGYFPLNRLLSPSSPIVADTLLLLRPGPRRFGRLQAPWELCNFPV